MIPINKPIIEKEEKEAVQRVLDSLYLTDASFEGENLSENLKIYLQNMSE